ncbi:MAG: hypothetical protein JRG91_08910 [Deltaproteobacteria bacterium]|nr:hypothetical protein [Deltaproteobacteria bacterium]
MITRILLVALLAFSLAACVVVTDPGPATPDPAALSPSKGSPEPAPVDDWKQCHEAEDCVPVGCGCSCSGCGGFSSEDIINKDHEDAWYEKKGCEPAHVCPEVCCPPMTIVCQDGQCGVVAGEKKNVH